MADIDINTLLERFAAEIAATTKRAVIAEAHSDASARSLEVAHERIQQLEERLKKLSEEPIELVDEPKATKGRR